MWSTNQISRILTRPIYTSNSLNLYNFYANTKINIVDNIDAFDGNGTLTIIGKETGKGKYRKNIDIDEQFLVTVDDIDAIMDSNTWVTVQNKMSKNKQYAPRLGQSKICFLSGLMQCSYCGYSMSIKSQNKNNNQYNYICCNTKKNRGYNVCASKLHILDDIQEAVLIHLIKHIKENKIYDKISRVKDVQQIDVSLLNQKSLLEANISKSNKEIQNLLKIVAEGNFVTNGYIQKGIEEIDLKIQNYKKDLITIESEIYNTYYKFDRFNDIKEYLKDTEKIITADFDTKKDICKSLIKKVIVSDENIEIEYII